MNVRTTLLGTGIGLALVGGLNVAPMAQAATPVPFVPGQLCPTPTAPGQGYDGDVSTNPTAVLDSTTFSGTGSSRQVHVEAHGFVAGESLTGFNFTAFCVPLPVYNVPGEVAPDGHLSIDIPVVDGVVNFIHLDGNKGTLVVFADDTGGGTGPVDPAPAKPGVTAASAGSSLTRLTITGETGATAAIHDASGRTVAGGTLTGGTMTAVVPTPTRQTTFTVTQAVGGTDSAGADVTLAPGAGPAVPAKTISTAATVGSRSVLTVTGEAGAVATATDASGKRLAVGILAPSGRSQLVLPKGTSGAVHVTQTRGGVISPDEIVTVR